MMESLTADVYDHALKLINEVGIIRNSIICTCDVYIVTYLECLKIL